MPTSVPRNLSSRPHAGEGGLTLVEVLVVLAIIAVASAAAMLSAGGGAGRSVDAEARRLALALQRASDDALVAARPATFAWDARRYSFAGADGAGEPRVLPEGVSLASTAQSPVEIAGDGLGPPLELTLSSGGDARTVRYDGLNAALVPGRP